MSTSEKKGCQDSFELGGAVEAAARLARGGISARGGWSLSLNASGDATGFASGRASGTRTSLAGAAGGAAPAAGAGAAA